MAADRAAAANGELPVLVVRGLSKRFSQQVALDSVELILRPGEIHGLIGENGSGKSTLIKILAGFYRADHGTFELEGVATPLPARPGEFRRLGFAFVHQDLGVILELTVAENLALVDLACSTGGWFLPRRELVARARETLDRFGLDLDPSSIVGALPPVERAMLAIVRAVSAHREEGGERHRLLVLDEPTVFLPRRDVARLFDLVRRIALDGTAVLFVSHDPSEVKELCSVITVLRDGKVAGVRKTEHLDAADIVELIVGRRVRSARTGEATLARRAGVRVDGLEAPRVHDLDFEIGAGEIFGIAGLAGSGYAEIPYILYGAQPARGGTISLYGDRYALGELRPRHAVRAGMVLIPGDRRRDGIVESLPVTDNVTLPRLREFRASGGLGRRRMVAETRSLMERFDVRPQQPSLAHGSLSGGNQQKAVLAKWLSTRPRLVMLDEPTQGVDVGSRHQIFTALRDVAASGASVLVASSDAEQLAMLCHRVGIFHGGRLVSELVGDDVTKEAITNACFDAGDVAGAPEGGADTWL